MSAKDSQGTQLEVGNKVQVVQAITVNNKGSIPTGTVLTVEAFGRTANHIDVTFQNVKWYIDAKCVKKS